jgi:hypothetical protein
MGFPGAIVHDPRADWCACTPLADARCDYRMLADAVEGELNPPDGDGAEVDICITAVVRIAEFVRGLPCTCTPGDDGEPCGRCDALGQRRGLPTGCDTQAQGWR